MSNPNYTPMDDARVQRETDEYYRQRQEATRQEARQAEIARLAREQMRQAQQEGAARQQLRFAAAQTPTPGFNYAPQPTRRLASPSHTQPRTPEKRIRQSERQPSSHRRFGKKAVISSLLVGGLVAGGGAAYLNRDALGGFINGLTAEAQIQDHSVKVGDINSNLDSAAFAPDVCMTPDAVLMVANFKEVSYPLVPLITTSQQATAGPSAKIFDGTTPQGLSGDYKTAFENDAKASVDGYSAATIENLPVAIMACEDGDGAISQTKDAATVDMTKFKIVFGDPSQVFSDTSLVNALYTKAGGTEDIKLDASKGEYLKYADPAYWLMQSSDKVQVDSATAVSQAMFTPTQMQAILATVEASTYTQLIDPTYTGEGISYPDATNDLRQAVKNAIAKRLKLDASKINFLGSNFKYSLELPKDPATKQAVTDIDPKTGKSSLVGLDPTQKAHIGAIDIVNGTLTPPKVSPSPPASPTPTTSTPPATAKP